MSVCDVTWDETDPALPHHEHQCVFRLPTASHSRHECTCGLDTHTTEACS